MRLLHDVDELKFTLVKTLNQNIHSDVQKYTSARCRFERTTKNDLHFAYRVVFMYFFCLCSFPRLNNARTNCVRCVRIVQFRFCFYSVRLLLGKFRCVICGQLFSWHFNWIDVYTQNTLFFIFSYSHRFSLNQERRYGDKNNKLFEISNWLFILFSRAMKIK